MTLLPKIKFMTLPTFPSTINGGAGIDVTTLDGAMTVNMDWSEFATQSVTPDSPTNNVLTFDTATNSYIMIPTSLFGGGGGGGIADAPVDGRQYGRQSAAWTLVPASIPDAPEDGQLYGRQSAAWALIADQDFQSDLPTTPAVRTVTSKLRDRADLRDWSGLDLTDTNDNASLMQDALNKTAASGDALHIPAGKIALGSKINWPSGSQIIGEGMSGKEYDPNYSWFHLAHPGIGFEATGVLGARSMQGVNFRRNQPAPAPGWAPGAFDYDISLKGTHQITITDCNFLNPTRLLQAVGDMTGAGTGNGRMILRNIKGHPLLNGFSFTHTYDVVFLDEIFLGPLWSNDPIVIQFTRNNSYAFIFARIDNPKLGRIFAICYWRGIAVFQQPDVGKANLPGGTANLVHGDVIAMDDSAIGLLIDPGSIGATLNINDFYAGGAVPIIGGPSPEASLQVMGTNSMVAITNMLSYSAASAATIIGTGNLVTLGTARSSAASFADFTVGAGNTLRLTNSPLTSAPLKYNGSGLIETPDWRPYTPTVGSEAGALTSASATGKFRRIGKTVDYEISITITTNGSAGGFVRAGLPFVSASGGPVIGMGRRNDGVGKMVFSFISASITYALVGLLDNSYPGGDGALITISGTYEAA